MRVEHEVRYAAVAAKGGAPTNPQWYASLVAEPVIELQDGAVTREYRLTTSKTARATLSEIAAGACPLTHDDELDRRKSRPVDQDLFRRRSPSVDAQSRPLGDPPMVKSAAPRLC